MIGGDDLASDDEFLDQSWNGDEPATVAEESRYADDAPTKKRTVSDLPDSDSDENIGKGRSSNKKNKQDTKGSPAKILLEAGRGISEQKPDVQAAFLSTCFKHWLLLEHKFESSDFLSLSRDRALEDGTFISKFKRTVSSMKRLKKWKVNQSPMVLIVCVSARRAVSILKDVSSLNVRAVKLFAKHMCIEDQTLMLKKNAYGIAVGTPNRLLKLFETRGSDDCIDGTNALSLALTEVVIVDSWEDNKRFTVCTMNDTACLK